MTPSGVAGAAFAVVRRGYDQAEVRAFLSAVAEELDRLSVRELELATKVNDANAHPLAPGQLDEETVTSLLGEEAARLLTTAREASTQIRTKAEDSAERLVADARADAETIRTDAEADAGRLRSQAADEAATSVSAAQAEAAKVVGSARQQGREMVEESQAYRERVLGDLSRRRDLARQQLDQLQGGRERLLGAFTSVRATLEQITDEVAAITPDSAAELDTGPVPAETAAGRSEQPTLVALAIGEEPEAAAAVVVPEPDVPDPDVPEPDVPDPDVVDDPSDPPPRAVDDLFARIRAARTDGLLEDATTDDETADGATPDEATAEATPDDDSNEIEVAETVISHRNSLLAPLETSMARRLKRALADEQNEVFDLLRRQSSVPVPERVLGSPQEHAERYRAAAEDDVWAAAVAGAHSLAELDDDAAHGALDAHRVLDEVLDEVTSELSAPLRERLSRSLEQAGDDPSEASDLLRAAYREWKTQRIDAVAAHLALTAHGLGAVAALPTGTPVCWLTDPTHAPCADADDNVLAGAVSLGDPFPTGHVRAPAYPGCRCALGDGR